MAAMLQGGQVCAAGFVEPSPGQAAEATRLAPGCRRVDTLAALLDLGLDGLVIATPSALHAEQSLAALNRGVAVFCQKPLGRDEAETAAVVAAAERADRLLGVDLSYRHIDGMRQIRTLVTSGALGRVHAVDLVFHNAYGPDKPWFYDPGQSGGGCVIDLGVHLIDLALWTLGFPDVAAVSARSCSPAATACRSGRTMWRTTPSPCWNWQREPPCNSPAPGACTPGQGAIISAAFHGAAGGATLRNQDGSFYDFTAERHRGTSTQALAMPPDPWGGRAAVEWAAQLAAGGRFDPDARRFVDVARCLDRIYRQARSPATREMTPPQSPGVDWR